MGLMLFSSSWALMLKNAFELHLSAFVVLALRVQNVKLCTHSSEGTAAASHLLCLLLMSSFDILTVVFVSIMNRYSINSTAGH